MSKLKLPMFHFMPLCLKIHAQRIYIATGLLIVSSILLMILIFAIKNDAKIRIQSEQNREQQEVELVQKPLQELPDITVALVQVVPEVIPEVAPIVKAKKESQDIIDSSSIIKGQTTLDFGWQLHPVYRDWRYHTGIDISASLGQVVPSICSGEVIDIFHDRHNGLTVLVKNNIYSVYYGSLAKVNVDKGSHITVGQAIGIIGSCDAEPYPHLHLAIKKGEQYIEPKLVIGNQ